MVFSPLLEAPCSVLHGTRLVSFRLQSVKGHPGAYAGPGPVVGVVTDDCCIAASAHGILILTGGLVIALVGEVGCMGALCYMTQS